MLNARGTYEADVTVTRTAADEFLVVSSSATTVRDLDWLGGTSRTVRVDVDDLTERLRGARRDGAARRASCWPG